MDDEILVRWFLEHGAHPSLGPQMVNPKADSASINSFGTCVDVAAQKSSILVFDMLLDHGAPRENSVALHMAAGAGVSDERIPMMTHLVALSFDVNRSDEVRGSFTIGTPLHYAIRAGSVEKIKERILIIQLDWRVRLTQWQKSRLLKMSLRCSNPCHDCASTRSSQPLSEAAHHI